MKLLTTMQLIGCPSNEFATGRIDPTGAAGSSEICARAAAIGTMTASSSPERSARVNMLLTRRTSSRCPKSIRSTLKRMYR